MKVKKIFLYSYDKRVREINFKLNGVNIITGAKSTGKSSIIDIIDYCSGRTDCMISGGVISNKTSWVGTLFEFEDCSQVMIIKPLPKKNRKEVSQSFLKLGHNLSVPKFDELILNSNDETNLSILGGKLDIKEYFTNIGELGSRNDYKINFKHTKYYIFQPQNLIANKSFLFFNQDDYWKSMGIKDTLPIILKVDTPERKEVLNKIKVLNREITILEKSIDSIQKNLLNENSILSSLFYEAKILGILESEHNHNILNLKNILEKKSTELSLTNDPSINEINKIQRKISKLRKERADLSIQLNGFKVFQQNKNLFIKNKNKDFCKLEIIDSFLLKNIKKDSDFNYLVDIIKGEFDKIKKTYSQESISDSNVKIGYIEQDIRKKIDLIDSELKKLFSNLEHLNQVGDYFKNDYSNNRGLNILLGKVSLLLSNYDDHDNLSEKKSLLLQKNTQLTTLINQSNGFEDSSSLLDSIIFRISSKISEYLKKLSYEHSENPTRFDLKSLTVYSTDKFNNLLPMNRVGSGANYLALHLATLLSFHYYFRQLECSVPSFLVLDQPTQVFFPPIISFENIREDLDKYNSNVDIQEVRKLFQFLIDYTKNEVPNFQIIITEHAYINEVWFKDMMIEEQWIPPSALIPNDWPSSQDMNNT